MSLKLANVTCRPMQPQELPEVVALHESVLGQKGFARRAQSEGYGVLVALCQGQIAGYILHQCVASRRAGSTAIKLCYVGVKPEFLRRGICSSMLDCIKQKLRDEGHAFVFLELASGKADVAYRCYHANGFVRPADDNVRMFYPQQPGKFFDLS